MSTINVMGAIVSKNGVTLFLADGTSEVLASESYRTQAIVEEVLPGLARNPGKPYAIDLGKFSLAKRVEEMTGGAIKVEEKNGKTAISTGTVTVEDGDKLKKHLERAAYGEGAKGFQAFMSDFARIPHKHSAQELLEFMRINDLPICDDGSILVYKYLDKAGEAGVYVDHHTGKVKQRLGSKVMMPVEKVDDNRRVQCSTGLHVCSSKYGSYGNTVFLAKVRPADVIAVPLNENGKMRCAAYHLVAILPQSAYHQTRQGISAITDPAGKKVVEEVLAGNHIDVIEEVIVHGSTYQDKDTPIEVRPVEGATGKVAKKVKPRKVDVAPKVDPKQARQLIQAAMTGDMSLAITQGAARANLDKRTKPKKDSPVMKSLKSAKADVKAVTKKAADPVKKSKLSPAEKKAADYAKKLEKAKKLYDNGNGLSLREIEKKLGMCRKSLAKHLKAA